MKDDLSKAERHWQRRRLFGQRRRRFSLLPWLVLIALAAAGIFLLLKDLHLKP